MQETCHLFFVGMTHESDGKTMEHTWVSGSVKLSIMGVQRTAQYDIYRILFH